MTWRAVVSCLSLSLEWGGHGPMVVVAKERKRLTERKYGGTERVPRPRICSIWKGAGSWGRLVDKSIFKKLRMD